MKLAAIDIGTNSMRLLVAEVVNGDLINRKKFVDTTRIGEGVDSTGLILEEAIVRNIEALGKFKKICMDEKCKEIFCMGTSALRDSKNNEDFISRAKQETGIDVEILSGNEEANLGLVGVIEGLEDKSGVLVVDIGGGSTEFTVGDKSGIKYNRSKNVGALRMTEKFLKKDPIDDFEYKKLEKFVEDGISNTVDDIESIGIKKLVGIGGTITSLSAINQKLEVYSMEKVHNSKIFIKDVEQILQMLKESPLSDKKKLAGLQKKRADIITAGVGILKIIMKKLEIKEITVSEYDNLEGLICQKSKKM
ncbi:Ppx/GppA phosphatase family protein [Metaclostridioides mangenotii]|uniref:Ppx/GppA phosphatase family protein n=1 Tax=Metaclostridioides mangenotii TaxID=1540 RepID=UPI0028E68498|nr:Ppx/GppA phosphatase family protein [Clostridioides mangenotii]